MTASSAKAFRLSSFLCSSLLTRAPPAQHRAALPNATAAAPDFLQPPPKQPTSPTGPTQSRPMSRRGGFRGSRNSGNTNNNVPSGPISGTPGSTSSSQSFGGGVPRIIVVGAPFAGRSFGGGSRPFIGGGLAFGAGYGAFRYGRVGGRGFPFGYWPLYYGVNYYDNDEYGPSDNSSRPGGPLVASSFSPPSSSPLPQYLIHGDTTSISTILDSLTTQCSALIIVPSTPLLGDNSYPPSTNLTLLPTPNPANIQQYYRDSSFALYAYFDDLIPSPEASINFTAPSLEPFIYAAALRNTTFDACVNATISENLPIEEGTSGVVRIGMLLQGVGVGAKGQLVILTLVVGMWGSM